MPSSRIRLAPDVPEFAGIALGLWRLANWERAPSQRLSLVEQTIDLGVTTIDHADISRVVCTSGQSSWIGGEEIDGFFRLARREEAA